MKHEFVDGRLLLRRTPEEREPLLARLRRIEGQVRGLRQMLEEDRYCRDEMQQVNAITAALREVALLIVSQHLNEGITFAQEGEQREEAIAEMLSVMRAALRQG